MIQDCQARVERAEPDVEAGVVDLTAHRIARLPARWDEAALAAAAAALLDFEVGVGGWAALAARLVAPFNA